MELELIQLFGVEMVILSTMAASPVEYDPHGHGYESSSYYYPAMIFIIILCALVFGLALKVVIRCFSRGGRRIRVIAVEDTHRIPDIEAGAAPPLVVALTVSYAPGLKLGGAETECAICLSEFLEGEDIRVLGSCQHGFHVPCVERWLTSHPSCPMCRRSCLATSG